MEKANRARLGGALLIAPVATALYTAGDYNADKIKPAKKDRGCIREFYYPDRPTTRILSGSECDRPGVIALTLASEDLNIRFTDSRGKQPSRVSANVVPRPEAIDRANKKVNDVKGGHAWHWLRWTGGVALVEALAASAYFGNKRSPRPKTSGIGTKSYPDLNP